MSEFEELSRQFIFWQTTLFCEGLFAIMAAVIWIALDGEPFK